MTLASVLAIAVLGGVGYFFVSVIQNSTSDDAEESAEGEPRLPASDGTPVEEVTIESLTVSDPASVDDGAAECEYVPASEEQLAENPNAVDAGAPEDGEHPNTGSQEMVLDTNHGEIVVDLDNENAPCAAANFTYLAAEGFYDDTICHRLTTEGIYVLQCGNPTAVGEDAELDSSGGVTYTFDNENEPEDTMEDLSEEEQAEMQMDPEAAGPDPNYPEATLALANAGEDTNGSQFFLVYDDTYLPPQYTIAGEISAGLDILQEIAAAGADEPASKQEEEELPMPM